ncbi:hypothetical protein LSAT2_017007, partial [Lamellibrachia satsuma]
VLFVFGLRRDFRRSGPREARVSARASPDLESLHVSLANTAACPYDQTSHNAAACPYDQTSHNAAACPYDQASHKSEPR